MVAITATQQFPYPTGPDKPCESWKTWKTMAQGLDSKLTALSADLDRTARAVPIAKVSMTGPFPVGGDSDGEIVFDTVHVDTDGMADLNRAPKVLLPTRRGWYSAYAHIRWSKLDLNSLPQPYISGSGGSLTHAEAQWQGGPGALDDGAILHGIVFADAPPDQTPHGISFSYSGTTLDDVTVLYAELTLYWIADA